MNSSLRSVYISIAAAFVLWFLIFAYPAGNFWIKLIVSASLLAAIGLAYSRGELKALFAFRVRHLWVGIGSALLLYGIFWIGKEAANLPLLIHRRLLADHPSRRVLLRRVFAEARANL